MNHGRRTVSLHHNDKLPKFMENMHFILSASVFESQGMGIIEAMCCGLQPIIFDFPGAKNIFPQEWLWIDYEEFESIITESYEPKLYHNYAVENYSIERNIHQYKNLIRGVLENK